MTISTLHLGKGWGGTYEVVLEPDAFVEERLLDAQSGRLKGVVHDPERDAGRVAHARCAVARDAIGFAAMPLCQSSPLRLSG